LDWLNDYAGFVSFVYSKAKHWSAFERATWRDGCGLILFRLMDRFGGFQCLSRAEKFLVADAVKSLRRTRFLGNARSLLLTSYSPETVRKTCLGKPISVQENYFETTGSFTSYSSRVYGYLSFCQERKGKSKN
jgi:hypothetical protein